MLPHKMAKYHMIGEQVSKKEKGPGPSFSQQTVPVVAKMLPWQLTLLWYEHQLTRVEPFPSPPPHITYSFQKAPPHHNNQVSNTHCTDQWQACWVTLAATAAIGTSVRLGKGASGQLQRWTR